MREFNFEDNEEMGFFDDMDEMDDDDMEDEDDDDDDDVGQTDANMIVEMAQLDLVVYDLNLRLLSEVVRSLEKSCFWKFKTNKTKMRLIQETYELFNKLIQGD
jgi:hypothetical protein